MRLTDTHATLPAAASTSQLNWLELARFAAQGEGHSDLGRAILRLATLAAATHREQYGHGPAEPPVTLGRQTQWNLTGGVDGGAR